VPPRLAAPTERRRRELKDDGTTACWCWIYSGSSEPGRNRPRAHKPTTHCSAEWGFACGQPPGFLYNRASAARRPAVVGREDVVWWPGSRAGWMSSIGPEFRARRSARLQRRRVCDVACRPSRAASRYLKARRPRLAVRPRRRPLSRTGPLPTHSAGRVAGWETCSIPGRRLAARRGAAVAAAAQRLAHTPTTGVPGVRARSPVTEHYWSGR